MGLDLGLDLCVNLPFLLLLFPDSDSFLSPGGSSNAASQEVVQAD